MSGTLRIHFTDQDFRLVQLALAPDPMWEAILALHVLQSPAGTVPLPFRAWRGKVRRFLTEPQVGKALQLLADLAPSNAGYFPDFLTPVEAQDGLEAGIDALRHTSRNRLAHELRYAARTRRLAGWTSRLATGERQAMEDVAAAVIAVNDRLITPDWAMVDAAVQRDRLMKLEALQGGIDGLLASLGTLTWQAPVLSAPYPVDFAIHLKGRGLRLIPSYFCHGAPVAIVDELLPPVVVYPIDHLMPTEEEMDRHALALKDVVGRNRARSLEALRHPTTTGRLAARLGISESAASGHIKALRNLGLVDSTWHGGFKVHALTAGGHLLLRPHRLR